MNTVNGHEPFDHATESRLDALEHGVWLGIAAREKSRRKLTMSFGALAFVAIFAGSYGAGSLQGGQAMRHLSMTGELSESGDFG
jgi:hypothetical protein